MKIVKNISGNGRLPSEYVQMKNTENLYEEIAPTDKLMITFLETYNGHYKDDVCEWVISYV